MEPPSLFESHRSESRKGLFMSDALKLLLFLFIWYILLYMHYKFAETRLWLWKSHNGVMKGPNCKVYYSHQCAHF